MDDLLARRHHQVVHIFYQLVNILAANLSMQVFPGDQTAVLQTFDVLTSNTHVYYTYLHVRLRTGNVNCDSNTLYCFINVRYHTTGYACRFGFTDAQHLYLAVFTATPNNGTYLSSPDIQSYDDWRTFFVCRTLVHNQLIVCECVFTHIC